MLSPKSKRRRKEQIAQPQQATPSQSSAQQPSQNISTNNDNSYITNNNETPARMANGILTSKRPHRKTVVVFDIPQQNDSPSILRTSQEEIHLMNDNSFRSVQSSGTFASAQEFMIDCETDDRNAFRTDEDTRNNEHTRKLGRERTNKDQFTQISTMTPPTITTNPNDASNSTGVTARKSSEASSSTGTSSVRSGQPSTTVRGRNDTKRLNNKNTTNSTPINERKDVTWQEHGDNNEEKCENSSSSNDDDDDDSYVPTCWELFIQTISTVPDDEYYTKSCTTSYDILQKSRITLGYAVTNHVVQTIIIILIIINALLMGVATFDFVTEDPKVLHIFYIVDLIFLIIFTIELGFQLFYRGISLLYDAWLLFDFIIIVLSWSLQSIQIIRAFRIFRALRLVARLQVLRELIIALGAVMPRMYAISMLLFLIFYIFAVLFTQLFGELELSGNYFSTLDASLFTCMNMMTLEWINVTREVMTHRSWAWAPITSFISITGFIVYNLVVAVVCDAVAVLDRNKQIEADAVRKEMDDKEYAVAQKDQMNVTQQRFEDLSNSMERMRQQHVNICHTVDMLTSELQQSMIVIANLQQQLAQTQTVK